MSNLILAAERQSCWEHLRESGVVEGELPAASELDASVTQAWYIRVMLGFAGWLGALFLIAFVGIGFEFVMKTALLAISLGGAVCAVAYVILSLRQSNDFMQQFGLALSMAGQGLVLIGLLKGWEQNMTLIALAMLAFQVVLLVLMPNSIHKFVSGLGVVWALSHLLAMHGVAGLSRGLIALLVCAAWWSPLQYRYQKILRPFAFALSFAVLCFEAFSILSPLSWFVAHRVSGVISHAVWIGKSLLNVALLVSTILLLQRESVALSSRLALFCLASMSVVMVATYFMPGFGAAVLMLMIAFAHSNRILTGMSVLAMLGFLSHFYYQMQMNLFDKSLVLAATALSLFLLRSLMLRLFPDSVKEQVHV